jgi:hypothetical protein
VYFVEENENKPNLMRRSDSRSGRTHWTASEPIGPLRHLLACHDHEHWLLNLLERWLVLSRATIVVPLYKRVVFVRFLNCPEFSIRLSKISQAHNTISGIQFRVGSRGLDERWSLGAVCVGSCSGV